jgi:cytochrome c-type biogenesis protein CcmF
VPTRPNEDPLVARGTALVLSTITLLAAALVITFGTSAPLLTAFLENPGQVGPEFYNRVNLPIALLLALLLALVPFLTWRGSPPKEMLRKMLPSLAAAAVVAAVAAIVAVRNPFFLLYFFLATLAIGTNLHKTVLKAFPGRLPEGTPLLTRTQAWLGGLTRAGGYLAHVGVGIILIGFLASSGFDRSTKVTLALDEPREVGGRTLTFIGFKEKTSPRDKDTLVVEVREADGTTFWSEPKLFRNERSGQTMANPDVTSFLLADFYVSPLEYQPGEPAGSGELLALARGESATVGDYQVRFAGFDLGVDGGNALARMAEGAATVTLGVQVELTGPDGETRQVLPLYRIDQARGMVQTPPVAVPGGGMVRVAGINPAQGQARLTVQGLPGMSGEAGKPPSLAVDVTEKPLIQLVWFGLWVILTGGVLAVVNRLRQAMKGDPQALPESS